MFIQSLTEFSRAKTPNTLKISEILVFLAFSSFFFTLLTQRKKRDIKVPLKNHFSGAKIRIKAVAEEMPSTAALVMPPA